MNPSTTLRTGRRRIASIRASARTPPLQLIESVEELSLAVRGVTKPSKSKLAQMVARVEREVEQSRLSGPRGGRPKKEKES